MIVPMMSELFYAALGHRMCWVFCRFVLLSLCRPEPLNFYDRVVRGYAENYTVLLSSPVGYFLVISVIYGDYNVS